MSELDPSHPIIEDEYAMTPQWSVRVPRAMNRRFESDSLLLWRPGLTTWITIWGNDENSPQHERLALVKQGVHPTAFAHEEQEHDAVTFYSYRRNEEQDGKPVLGLYCFAIGDSGHVQMAVYFDEEKDLPDARYLWETLRESKA